MAHMKKLALIVTLLLGASPVAAQVATLNGQQQSGVQLGVQSGVQRGQPAPSQAPTTGTICIEEMTATFCNVSTGPNTNGYGSSAASAPSGGPGANTSSIPHCAAEPPFNEMCN
jgi:hypothetical protein